ncbi:MAG: formylmethanofuran dehydrogenase subunit E family protein [Desulfobacteraceae bacterium]|jgi:formylmethanofuran dehydrogenase subunit E
MEKTEALRSIQHDLVEYIQAKVLVDFDNARQMPLSFIYKEKTYVVREILGRFLKKEGFFSNGFLVNVNGGEVFFIYFHIRNPGQHMEVCEGNWILCFRILNDNELMAFYREDRKMLLNMTMKRLVDFHGHICPDLVIGAKLSEYIQQLVAEIGGLNVSISILAQNCTSAIDAIQILLGATFGNQRLQVMDFGKHVYSLVINDTGTSFMFSLKQQKYGDEVEFDNLEQKIMNSGITLEETVCFQKLMDRRIEKLFSMTTDELFNCEEVEKGQLFYESPSIYLTCSQCAQQVLKNRSVEYRNKIYCISCFHSVCGECKQYNLQ